MKLRYFKKIFFCSSLYFLCGHFLYAQTVMPPARMEIYMQLSNSDSTIVFDNKLFSSQSILLGTVFIKLQDSLGLAKIHVKLGTTSGGNDIFSKTFLFDVTGNFSDGTSYLRNGLKVLLGIGQFVGLNNYYSEVRLEDTSQNLSPPIYYNKN